MLWALLLTLTLTTLALLGFLLRPGSARPGVVWGVTALLPLTLALAAAYAGQARAERTLAAYRPTSTAVVVSTGGREYDLLLSAEQAACLERALRLGADTDFTPGEPGSAPVPLRADTKVAGQLPERQMVEALGVRGQLQCPQFHSAPTEAGGKS